MPGLFHTYPILIPYYAWFIQCLFHTYPLLILCLQDTVLTVPQYPFVLEDPSNLPGEDNTDTAQESGRRGSNVYEVNQWLWEFGRGKPRLGGLSVTESAGGRRIAVLWQDGLSVAMPNQHADQTKAEGGAPAGPVQRRMTLIGH